MSANALRSFLVASPRPAKILITSGDGEQQEVLPPKGIGGVTWAGVARSIETLDPSRIELFDVDNKLIRAQGFDAQSKDDAAVELPAILARDAESARVALFASHIAAAYKFSVETAFTKMVEMFERADSRQERLEARLERVEGAYRRTMQERIDEAFDDAEQVAKEAEAAKADPLTGLIQSFAGGVSQGANAAPNGKSKQ